MAQSNLDVSAAHRPHKSAVVAKEIRFSVVMYGGVSLAIYMNGVTQELLHMVRSTARNGWNNEPGTEFRFVQRDDPRASKDQGNLLNSTEEIYRKLANELNDSGVDDVRFIIDLISGTSAGGINGIFLAKALSDDSLDLNTLQSLWIEQGGLENLLNDKQTRRQVRLLSSDAPKSLLCSDRMYLELLGAFRTMGSGAASSGEPLCREIDLFATTTDINGRVIPLRLADMLVWERRYKQDFHLRFNKHRNDFRDENNPFLAFIARCTSSFPFAFEPMQLAKLKELQGTKAWPSDVEVDDEQLKQWSDEFFDNSRQLFTGDNLTRPFGDGGYLNNKPFSYAIDLLGRHSSEFPTERKLIYVEPAPEHPETGTGPDAQTKVPGPITNSFDALIKLPGFQPIHDDLQRVTERNRVVRKVAELSATVTARIYTPAQSESAQPTDRLGITCIDPAAVGDFSYLVLRTYATTDELANVMAQWFEFAQSSSFYYGLRCVVRAWREAMYEGYGEHRVAPDQAVERYRAFLVGYDLDYEKRKYRFIREQINVFYSCDAPARTKLQTGFNMVLETPDQTRDFQQALIKLKKPFDDAYEVIGDAIRALRPDPSMPRTGARATLVDAAEALKQAAHEFRLQNKAAPLERDDAGDATLAASIPPETSGASAAAPQSGKSIIEFVLGIQKGAEEKPTAPAEFDESYAARARRVFADPTFGAAVHRFAGVFSDAIVSAARDADRLVCDRLADISQTLPSTSGAGKAIEIVKFFHSRFEVFDAALFPMIYDTGIGTPELISVIRVSPDDCTHLFDHPGKQKLAGTALAHFGAFLDRCFRTNDILWGRLDGAERIVHALLTSTQLTYAQRRDRANTLINEAHAIIIGEFLEDRQQELAAVLHEVAKSLKPPLTDASQQAIAVRDCVNATLETLPQQGLKDAVKGFLTVDRIRTYLAELPPAREPDRRTTLESITRTIRIIGGMLQGLGDETKAAGGFLIRVATALWWLVEAAVPRGLTGHFFRKFFAMLTWFAIVMIVAGTILNHSVQTVGFELLGVTVVLWLLKDGVERFLLHGNDRRRGPRVTGLLAIAVTVAFVAVLTITERWLNPWLHTLGFRP